MADRGQITGATLDGPLALDNAIRVSSSVPSGASTGENADCLARMARGEIDPRPLLSATAPLAEGAAWFDRLYRKEPGLLKVVLNP